MQQDFNEPAKASALRTIYRKIVMDFDAKRGGFSSIEYESPWVLASEEWQSRTGYTQAQLENIITEQRLSLLCAEELAPELKEALNVFRRAVAEWREETGYVDRPFQGNTGPYDKALTKRLRDFVWARWVELGLRDPSFGYADRALEFSGFFDDRIGHVVALRFYIDRVAGYRLAARFRFPYFGLDMPKSLEMDILTGVTFARGIGFPSQFLVRTVRRDDLRSVNEVLSIIKVTKDYLESTRH